MEAVITFDDDGGGDEKEDEGELKAGVTGACEGAGDSPPPDVFSATSKKRPRPALVSRSQTLYQTAMERSGLVKGLATRD